MDKKSATNIKYRWQLFVAFTALQLCSVTAFSATQKDLQEALLEKRTVSTEELQAMDTNGDGEVNVADLVTISSNLPTIEFASTSTEAEEGQGIIKIPISLSAPFSGELTYYVMSSSNTPDSEIDIKTIHVDESSAEILVENDDNTTIESTEIMQIILVTTPSSIQGYHLGNSTSHLVTINDNDAIWTGTMTLDDLSVPLSMRIIQQESEVRVDLLADGRGIIPSNTQNQTETGESFWAATSILIDTSQFSANFDGITAKIQQAQSLSNLVRNYEFIEGQNIVTQENVKLPIIQGKIKEQLIWEGAPHFNRTRNGTFLLSKQVDIPVRDSEL